MSLSLKLLFLMSFFLAQWIECKREEYVTCGTVAKLYNTDLKVRLHSHDVKYGAGSGQQSVTGTELSEDINSHWEIKGPTNKICKRGEPIRCGNMIRLTHLTTKKNLHSHLFSSPLSGNQEVSAYGNQGEGDSGDHWFVDCSGDFWERDDDVQLRHVDTGAFLMASSLSYGRPISGQKEIAAVKNPGPFSTHWRVKEGIFIHTDESNEFHSDYHTEL
ncbi:stromal cell-derived factor 2 [Daktulosphaira vitifoliae]|uniref:stromal cell-derived factor 2 n=1 Tax=Daktulosphaira vitifoliae TaxID=58002 RepID=UPI0021AAA4DF|nr:stromal cell-derived factor 2 [Daktulosphaira vitifoliae]